MVSKKRINAIADEAVASMLKKGEAIVRPYWLARGHHTDPVTGEVTVTQIEGVRPDKVSPAEKRAKVRGAPVYHTLPLVAEMAVVINPLSGKPHLEPVPVMRNRKQVMRVFSLDPKHKRNRFDQTTGGVKSMSGQLATGRSKRHLRRYRAKYPELNQEELLKKMMQDMLRKLAKKQGQAVAA